MGDALTPKDYFVAGDDVPNDNGIDTARTGKKVPKYSSLGHLT